MSRREPPRPVAEATTVLRPSRRVRRFIAVLRQRRRNHRAAEIGTILLLVPLVLGGGVYLLNALIDVADAVRRSGTGLEGVVVEFANRGTVPTIGFSVGRFVHERFRFEQHRRKLADLALVLLERQDPSWVRVVERYLSHG